MSQIIIQNCNQCNLDIPLKEAQQLYKKYQIRHPNAFFLRSKIRDWDGMVKFITKSGTFKIGLLPSVLASCKELGINPKIVDLRKPVPIVSKPVTSIGKYKLRPEQITAVSSVINNRVGGKPFHIGVLDYTVNAGKCTGKGTLIQTEDGLMPIEYIVSENGDIKYNGRILTKEGKLIKPSAGVYNEIKVIKLTTTQGYQLICGYDNHRLYTYYDDKLQWVYAKNLKVGDYLPISLMPTNSKYNIGNNLSYTLGALSGDGHIHQISDNQIIVSISGEDLEIAEVVKCTLDSICKTPIQIKPHRRFNGFHISKSDTNLTKLLKNQFPELIGNAYSKVVPNGILRASTSDIANYIAGLFDTDGHNSSSHGRRSLSFSTVSLENAKRVHQALLLLGIPSCFREKRTSLNGKIGITYRLTIHSEFYDKFLEVVPLRVHRKTIHSHSVRSNYGNKLPFSNIANIMYSKLSWSDKRKFRSEYGKTIRTQITHSNRLTFDALVKLQKFLKSNHIVEDSNQLDELILLSSQCYWDRVSKIEIIDKYPCYDMEIPEYHNYLSNGFISHNTLIMAAIYYSFKEKLKTLLITNDSDWLQQSKEEFKQYLPGEDITFVQGGNVKNWANFSIGMVQSISRNLKKYQPELAKIDMVLVDEADLAGNKSYQQVLTHLYNTRVRIGLSGTIYMSKYAKDRLKIMNLRSFFGDTLSEFRLSDSIKKGYSTKTIVKMVPAEPYYPNGWESEETDYKAIYDDTITNNRCAYEVVLDRLRYNMQYRRLPALVVCKYVQHCENIYKHIKATLEGNLNIAYVHVNTQDKARKKIMEDFRNGKIDILVSTTLIARGKNFPLLKLLINAASMDSQEKSIQFLGRLVRTHKSKSRVYLDDIQYFGDYLTRHGNHRRMYYQREKLKVIQLGKQWKKHPKHRPHPY